MRVLLVHPDDSPTAGPWNDSRWDLVVDLGWAGKSQYADWSSELACTASGIYSYADWPKDVLRIQEIYRAGIGCLVDAEGIDWWKLLAPIPFQDFYDFLLLLKIANIIQASGEPGEIRVTRSHKLANKLGKIMRVDVIPFIRAEGRATARLRRYANVFRTLGSRQIAGIVLDKWDTDYRFRRLLQRSKRSSSSEEKVLLPTAYRNVSRVLASYASLLPDRRFLMVTTRADGAIQGLPANVESVPLAAYSPRSKTTGREIAALQGKWRALRERLERSEPLISYAASVFSNFARDLKVGLRIRDAWRAVLDNERIGTVLSGDEHNSYTRLPILLARSRGVRTVYCSHGALDINLLIRGVCSDTYLAKGEMEKDYMVQQCGVPVERVILGAPPVNYASAISESTSARRDEIVFFSEPYELYSGRTETLYREVLPNLCAVARLHGRKVILKLHPFESVSGRRRLLDRILGGDDRQLVEISTEAISEKLMRRIWFALTVESSVAVECALAGVPSFLCGWFDLGMYCYGRQYEKFGAARILESPSAIPGIPEMLSRYQPGENSRTQFYQPMVPMKFQQVLHPAPVLPRGLAALKTGSTAMLDSET